MAEKHGKVKALFTKHAIGKHVAEGYWAQKKGDSITLRTPDGKAIPLIEGEELPGVVPSAPELSEDSGSVVAIEKKIVRVGESCIPLFETSDPNATLAPSFARTTRGKKGEPKVFMYEVQEGGKDVIKRLQEGRNHPQMGKVEILPNGQLKVGNKLIMVAPKLYEILLKADFDPKDEITKSFKTNKPYKASMVTKLKGGDEHWIHGYYFPATSVKEIKDGKEVHVYKGASFQEYGPDGYLYETASFRDRKQSSQKDPGGLSDKVALVTVRSVDDAFRLSEIETQHEKLDQKLTYIRGVLSKIGGNYSLDDHPLFKKGDDLLLKELEDEKARIQKRTEFETLRFSYMFGENTMKRHIALREKAQAPSNGWASKGP